MKNARLAVLILLILLGLAAGAAKVMKMPQELEFFGAVGLNSMGVTILGAAQMLGGLLMLFGKTRLPGALLLDVTLLLSAAVVFISGDIGFGILSLVPVVLNSLLIMDLLVQRARRNEMLL